MTTPEQKARQLIDGALERAGCLVQDRDEMDLAAGRGVAVRSFKLVKGPHVAGRRALIPEKPS